MVQMGPEKCQENFLVVVKRPKMELGSVQRRMRLGAGEAEAERKRIIAERRTLERARRRSRERAGREAIADDEAKRTAEEEGARAEETRRKADWEEEKARTREAKRKAEEDGKAREDEVKRKMEEEEMARAEEAKHNAEKEEKARADAAANAKKLAAEKVAQRAQWKVGYRFRNKSNGKIATLVRVDHDKGDMDLLYDGDTLLRRGFKKWLERVPDADPSNESGPSDAKIRKEFVITLDKTDGERIDIRTSITDDGNAVIVTDIHEGGLLSLWNAANPTKEVCVGDRVIEVNGVKNSGIMIEKEFQANRLSRLKILTQSLSSSESSEATSIPEGHDPEAANPEEAETQDVEKKPKKKELVLFNTTFCSYSVVVAAATARGWKPQKANGKTFHNFNVHWLDEAGCAEYPTKIMAWMKVNHFPATRSVLSRKSRLAKTMSLMHKMFPQDYGFVPDTWCLPEDLPELTKEYEKHNGSRVFIAKPDYGTQGRGIFLTNDLQQLKTSCCESSVSSWVVQRYIDNPLLIEGMKFDLRLYLLLTSKLGNKGELIPRYFLYRDGLVRLCTAEYEAPRIENMTNSMMHLTNYSINKRSEDFVQNDGVDDGTGNKRKLTWFMDYVEENHGTKVRDKLWNQLRGFCVKMCLAAHPFQEQEYNNRFPEDLSAGIYGCRCFEILGIDVMIDNHLRPYLIEVNHLPSFATDSPLDLEIKEKVISQSLDLCCSAVSHSDATTYTELTASKVRHDSSSSAVPASAKQWNLLDAPYYGGFERVFPGPSDMPIAAARYEKIYQKHCRPARQTQSQTQTCSGFARRAPTSKVGPA